MIEDDENESEDESGAVDETTPNAAEPKAVRRRVRKVDEERRQADEFWRAVLASPVGRKEIWGMLVSVHTFDDRFALGPTGFPQPEASWFYAGEQSFGLRLYRSLLRIDHDGIALMHREFDPEFRKK